ncbi:MAG: pilus assembly protein, partial [Endozoicomonas sp.]
AEYGDSPVVKTCQNLYIIFVTDGEPSVESTVNSVVKNDSRLKINGTTPITSCKTYDNNQQNGRSENCLPKLAEYLANPGKGGLDDNPATGDQKAFTYTIGFATDQELLWDTANKGGGICYTTAGSNSDSKSGCVVVDNIAAAFKGAVKEILDRTSTFVSPAVAVNSFNRTETLDNAYYAMFKPSKSSSWTGNLKKVKIFTSLEKTPGCTEKKQHKPGTVVDQDCKKALKTGTSQLAKGISTYWNTGKDKDGDQVEKGGLGAKLLNSRGTFYTNVVINDEGDESLKTLDQFDTSRFAIPGGKDYNATDLINWIKGKGKDGKTRSWVLGDILHSKPVTLNYGARTTDYSQDNPDIRLVFGTNHGLLHFIQDEGNSAKENWSFFAKETAANVPRLYEDLDDVKHPYGLDGQVSVIRLDYNDDGNIKAADKDRMVLFFGMRRGGSSYYAIDVTDPDKKPRLLWRIDHNTPGFEELGQSWSTPVPLLLPGHRKPEPNTDSGNTHTRYHYKIALAFGAGYDGIEHAPNNGGADDDRQGEPVIGSDGNPLKDEDGKELKQRKLSTRGRGLFFVDAGTGELIKSFTADEKTKLNYRDQRLKWSVVASPAVMDSNGNGFTDRVYFADTGGNVFRIDIGIDNGENGDKESAVWSMIKLAALGADEAGSRPAPDSSNDRRFMFQPELVRTIYDGVSYDAVVLGSGNQAHPLNENNADRYYVLRDKFISYQKFGNCKKKGCIKPPAQIKHEQLFNATSNVIQQGNAAASQSALNKLRNKSGWYIDLPIKGERTTTRAQVLKSQLLFSTYSPTRESAENACVPGIGSSRFYVVNLHTAAALRDVNKDGKKKAEDRSSLLSVVGTPGEATIISLGEGKNLIDLNTGYDGVGNEVGTHKHGWVQEL